AWLSSTAAAVAATLMWLNLRGFPAVLNEAAAGPLAYGAARLTRSARALRLGRWGTDAVGARPARNRDRALPVRAPRQPRRRHAAGDRHRRIAGAADRRAPTRRRAGDPRWTAVALA